MKRRTIVIGGATAALATAAGLRGRTGHDPAPVIPDVAAGDERVEQRESAARGKIVDFYTAVPQGSGDGRGLPVCLVLHGASKTAADFPALGLGRFLTDAVRRGTPPFVLAGATGGRLSWQLPTPEGDQPSTTEGRQPPTTGGDQPSVTGSWQPPTPDGRQPSTTDDPQRMVHEELPAWCRERGFMVSRPAVWGWSMGGYGALLLAETFPGFARTVAAFSPAVRPGDAVFSQAARLRGTPVGLWCGRQDGLYDTVRKLESALPERPVAGGYTDGRHNFGYWSTVIPAAFDFIGRALTHA